MRIPHFIPLVLFVLTLPLLLSSCSEDSNDDLHYISGTSYAYDAQAKSSSYTTIEYKYPQPTKPQGKGTLVYCDNTFEFEVDFNNNISITKVVELNNQEVKLPAFIDDKTVTSLGEKLFAGYKPTIIVVPYKCLNLKSGSISGTNSTVYVPEGCSMNNNTSGFTMSRYSWQ